VKLLHFSDTHLGFSEYTKIDSESGLNQREQDFYDAWEQVIEKIFEIKPDFIVHAGDLFHTPRPSNRAIRVALASIQKISDSGIPFIIIAGNHETPRIRTTGSIFESISLFPNVYAAFSNKYEKFHINGVDFHCVPHCSLTEDLEIALDSIAIDDAAKFNVLISHGAWSGKQLYGMGEFNEQRLPDIETALNEQFDYIALGHYHRQVDIKPHVCYSGSTERTSLNEHNTTSGFLTFDLNKKEKEHFQISTRSMIKIPPINCSGLTSSEIYALLEETANDKIKNAIVQIVLENIENDTFLKLDVKNIDDIFSDAFQLEKQLLKKMQDADESFTTSHIDSLSVEFERYLENIQITELDKTQLVKLGVDYLFQVEKI
jgi:DNA repair protein SbcD/Mre11